MSNPNICISCGGPLPSALEKVRSVCRHCTRNGLDVAGPEPETHDLWNSENHDLLAKPSPEPLPAEPSPEHPIYSKFRHDEMEDGVTPLYGISCNEGWRESIVCTDMYEWAADWLIEQIQGRPYAPGKH